MNALRAGALSVVEKPVGVRPMPATRRWPATICTQLLHHEPGPGDPAAARSAPNGLGRSPAPALAATAAAARRRACWRSPPRPAARRRWPGCSAPCPQTFPLPVLVVQHMGAAFMDGLRDLARRRRAAAGRARAGRRARPSPAASTWRPATGTSSSAPAGTLRVVDEPRRSRGQRPAATVLFRSWRRQLGAAGLGVLLTGMGEDGALGLARHAPGRRPDRGRAREHRRGLRHAGGGGAARRPPASILPLDRIAPTSCGCRSGGAAVSRSAAPAPGRARPHPAGGGFGDAGPGAAPTAGGERLRGRALRHRRGGARPPQRAACPTSWSPITTCPA